MSDVNAIIQAVWNEKYRYFSAPGVTEENCVDDTHMRVVKGVYAVDPSPTAQVKAFEAMRDMIWCPGGRIHAGAGTPKRVTWINCFVSPTIHDSMEGIMNALSVGAITQQQGGGIGMGFSTLRPKGAIVRRTGSVSSGVLPFMGMWNSMCGTIKSSGSRRGAMMAVLADWHPDVLDFIDAKHKEGILTNFNMSVLVSDKLMKAVKEDADWELGFSVPPADEKDIVRAYSPAGGEPWYVYKVIKARDLWDKIIKSTYEYAEPGVIFIDRVNNQNNLYYCETIEATNPCGEQPLPPNGDCDLGCVNLARLVMNPFTAQAKVNIARLEEAVKTGVRFLDNVLDTSPFPTEDQRAEALSKRRIGLGITGLANMLQMCRVRYGSPEAVRLTELVMRLIRDVAYNTSVDLAIERGPFPLYDTDKFMEAAFVKTLSPELQDRIRKHGIRNGVLLTIAPTGTTSIYYGNVSSGLEPSFDWESIRKMLTPDNELKEYTVRDYGYEVFMTLSGDKFDPKNLPSYMVSANELTVEEHLLMQAICQKYVDSSISKTINCPKDMTFADFAEVYTRAYELGCKGCTTYRPSGIRGAILISKSVKSAGEPLVRPEKLLGATYKIKWAGLPQAFYITINDQELETGRRPFEIFINSKSVQHQEWITALTRTISAVLRKADDPTFLVEELEQVFSHSGGQFVDGEYVPSLVAMIGRVLKKHFDVIGLSIATPRPPFPETTALGEYCPRCQKLTLIRKEGCASCPSCGYSNCA